jgi:hypothetical protein
MTAWGIESGYIDVAVREDVAVVTLCRPEKLNALTADMRRELAAILRHFGRGDSARGDRAHRHRPGVLGRRGPGRGGSAPGRRPGR